MTLNTAPWKRTGVCEVRQSSLSRWWWPLSRSEQEGISAETRRVTVAKGNRRKVELRTWATLWLCIIGAGSWASAAPVGKIEYNRDVRPILSENCFSCHG